MNVSGNVSDSTYSLQNHGTFWAQLFQVFHTNEGKSADALFGIKDDMPMAMGSIDFWYSRMYIDGHRIVHVFHCLSV